MALKLKRKTRSDLRKTRKTKQTVLLMSGKNHSLQQALHHQQSKLVFLRVQLVRFILRKPLRKAISKQETFPIVMPVHSWLRMQPFRRSRVQWLAQLFATVPRRSAHSSGVIGTEKCSHPPSRGLVLGVYADEHDREDNGLLTPAAAKYNEVG